MTMSFHKAARLRKGKPTMWGKVSAAAVVALCAAACNTDPIWEHRQRQEAPIVKIDEPDGIVLPDITIVDAAEVDLVEQVLTHRALYHRSLKALRDFYRDTGYAAKRSWAERELNDVGRITPFRYIVSAEIPSNKLEPIASIEEADAMYERGLELLNKGGHSLPIIFRERKVREALTVFRELIEKHPDSDKIDDAAFYCGEIHKEYFQENRLAVLWYERAYTWDPQTPHPARFQAAVVHDLRMHDRRRALELYHDVLRFETAEKSNVRFAVRRIEQLTKETQPGGVANVDTAATFVPGSTTPETGGSEP